MNGKEFMFPDMRTGLSLVPVLRSRDAGGDVERTYRKYHLDGSPLGSI